MATENLSWGYRRIVGELHKLGISIGATTIRDVLKRSGIHPPPDKAWRKPNIPWTTFIHANMESILATDFYTKPVYTLRGKFTAYVLVFIHLGSRRVYCSNATYHPNRAWMMQQARNVSMWTEDEGIEVKFLIRDRDSKFPHSFDDFWKTQDIRCIRTPVKSPKANAFAESFIGTIKKECLNYFVCFSRGQLDYITTTWLRHYHHERPHRGVGRDNTVLDVNFRPRTEGKVRCKSELGGIIKSYYRDAA